MKVVGKDWKKVKGEEGTKGGGLYVGQTDELGYRLHRHSKGWEKGTRTEVKEGLVWEVVGTVLGFGRGDPGKKRAKGVEEKVKKEKGKGFEREKFQGDGEEHKRRIQNVVEETNGEAGRTEDAWRNWTVPLEIKWWGEEERWSFKSWKTFAETVEKRQKAAALERRKR